MNKASILLSGGMDSTTLAYLLNYIGFDLNCLIFNYGQKHSKEIMFAEKTANELNAKYQVVDVSGLFNQIMPNVTLLSSSNNLIPEGNYEDSIMKETVVPNRNMILISIITSYSIVNEIHNIAYAAHSGDHAIYPDCRESFYMKMREAIKFCDWSNVNFIAPFINISKTDIASLGKYLGVDWDSTWSCYKGGDKHCLKCGTCIERLEAIENSNIDKGKEIFNKIKGYIL